MKTGDFGTPMAARRIGLELPLPLQFLAAWLAVWLGRVLQEEVDYLKAENHLLREKLAPKRVVLTDAERRRLATLGKALGRKGGGGRCDHCIDRDDSALVPKPRGQEVRREPAARAGAAEDRGRHRGAGYQNSERERVGLHTDQGRAQEPRPQNWTKHDQAHSPGEWHRPGARAWKANVLGDPHQSEPWRNRRHGLLHGRSGDLARTGSLPRAVRDRFCEQEGGDPWNRGEPWWPLDGTDGTKPRRCNRRGSYSASGMCCSTGIHCTRKHFDGSSTRLASRQ